MTVEGGNAFVSERIIANIATAECVVTTHDVFEKFGGGIPSMPDDPRVLRSAHSHVLCFPSGSLQLIFLSVIHL